VHFKHIQRALVAHLKQVCKSLELRDFLKVVVGALNLLLAVSLKQEVREQLVFTADLGVALPLLPLVVGLLLVV
jgi:hypothetical protein